MNKKKKTIRLYLLLTLLLTAVGAAAQTYALLFDYDASMSVYRSTDGAGAAVGWTLFAFVLVLGSSLFLLPKEKALRPVPPCGNALAFVAAVSAAAAVGSSVIVALDAAGTGGAIGAVSFLLALTSFPAGAYFLLMALFRRGNETALSVLGFFPVVWLSLGLMRIYFDRGSAINDPVKTLLQISLAAIMLYFLFELRARVGKGGFRLRVAFGAVALLLGFASSTSMLALVFAGVPIVRGEVILAVAELFLTLYVGGRLWDIYQATYQEEEEPSELPDGSLPSSESETTDGPEGTDPA